LVNRLGSGELTIALWRLFTEPSTNGVNFRLTTAVVVDLVTTAGIPDHPTRNPLVVVLTDKVVPTASAKLSLNGAKKNLPSTTVVTAFGAALTGSVSSGIISSPVLTADTITGHVLRLGMA